MCAGFDAEAFERIAAECHRVIGEDLAELERERVERPAELLRAEKKRRRQAGIVPRGDTLGARPQVVGRQASTTASVGAVSFPPVAR